MSFNFYIGSLVSRINLAAAHNKSCVVAEKSPVGLKILTLLMKNHFIKGFVVSKNTFIIYLRYGAQRSLIKKLSVISNPSKRVFISVYTLHSLIHTNPCSFFILSTTKGLLAASDCCNLNLGGELLFSINF